MLYLCNVHYYVNFFKKKSPLIEKKIDALLMLSEDMHALKMYRFLG